MTFTVGGTSGNRRIAGISVTYGEAATYNSNPECPYNVTIADNITNGTVTANPMMAIAGTNIALTAEPATGYHFDTWDVQTTAGTAVSVSNNSFEMPASHVTVSANFAINSYEVTATANPTEGGNVTGTGSYTYGSTVTLTATAAAGYTFSNWTVNGTAVSTDATYSFTATSDSNLVANFTLNNYSIAATANPTTGGTIEGAGDYDHFTTANMTATPATGYYFVSWTENDNVVSTSTSYRTDSMSKAMIFPTRLLSGRTVPGKQLFRGITMNCTVYSGMTVNTARLSG